MKIELKNIGTVKHAEIDLDKNLLIFCGPNNSGKTYVANSIYAIYKYSSTDIEPNFGFDEDTEIIEKIKSSTFNGHCEFIIEDQLVGRLINSHIEELVDYLPNVFATTQSFFSKSKLCVTIIESEIKEKINKLKIGAGFDSAGNIIEIGKNENSPKIDIFFSREINANSFGEIQNEKFTLGILSQFITEHILSSFFNKPYITPAERTAINIFSKELSVKRNEIVDRLLEYKGNNRSQNNPLNNAQRYPLPIRDSLEIAEDLSNLQKNVSDYVFLAEEIEIKILKGKINISTGGDVQFSPDKTKIKNLNIHLSASVVKSLSHLVFYFRHLAQKEDFIIIDEPELNLHPDNQIIMARILARIVNAGFKVLISTHSDYIIKELNNLVRLNSKKEHAQEIMQRYGYSYDELLEKDSLGVYLFKNNTAKSLEVDELGFDVSTIEKVNSELAQISESIYFDLLDKDDE